MTFGSSKLAGTPLSHREMLASSVKLLLLWVASSDGNLDESEAEYAASQFPGTTATMTTVDLLAVIKNSDLQSMERAIRAVAAESRELRTAFLDMAISMSMADRRMAITENHILRFYADALHLGLGVLQKRIRAISGSELREPGDPASPDWWDQIAKYDDDESGQDHRPAPRMSAAQAGALLGISADAGQIELEQAYQNLTAIFQIDRIEAMGEAAIALAKDKSKKIQEAYDVLRG